MGYQEEQKRLDRLAEVHEIATNAATEVKVWINRHPEVRDIHANYSIIYSYFNGDLESISADPGGSLDDAWENHPKFKSSLALWESEADEKQVLSDRIIELLRPGQSPQNLIAERNTHKYKSVVELRIRAGMLEEKSELRKKSTAELRQMLQKPQPSQSLPKDISAAQIKHMWGPTEFRYWTAKFNSMEPINRRLRGED